MTKPCPGLDEALLLFAHGELGFWPSLNVRWHAARCADCRARLQRYTSLSNALSLALASPAGARNFGPPAWKSALGKGALLGAFLIVIGGSIFSIYQSATKDNVPYAASTSASSSSCPTSLVNPKLAAPANKQKCAKPSATKVAVD